MRFGGAPRHRGDNRTELPVDSLGARKRGRNIRLQDHRDRAAPSGARRRDSAQPWCSRRRTPASARPRRQEPPCWPSSYSFRSRRVVARALINRMLPLRSVNVTRSGRPAVEWPTTMPGSRTPNGPGRSGSWPAGPGTRSQARRTTRRAPLGWPQPWRDPIRRSGSQWLGVSLAAGPAPVGLSRSVEHGDKLRSGARGGRGRRGHEAAT